MDTTEPAARLQFYFSIIIIHSVRSSLHKKKHLLFLLSDLVGACSARLEPGGPLKFASQRLVLVRVAAAYFIAILSSLTTAFAMPRLPSSLSMLLLRD